jgi:alpha-tubulin suppressor-like RCC1 family protein
MSKLLQTIKKDTKYFFHLLPLDLINELKKYFVLNRFLIGCGVGHTVIVNDQGEVFSAGSNEEGQLGRQSNEKRCDEKKFMIIDSLKGIKIKSVFCGPYHTILISEQGYVFSFGHNYNGQLGRHGDTKVPTIIESLKKINIIHGSCGYAFTILLSNQGEVFSFGVNGYHQLGRDGGEFEPSKIESVKDKKIIFSSCGLVTTFLLSDTGEIIVFGRINNEYYRSLKINSHNVLEFDKKINFINSSYVHFVFINDKKKIYSCGSNLDLQLGYPCFNQPYPTMIDRLRNEDIIFASCGLTHTIALNEKGRVFSFGGNDYGQLGHSNQTNDGRLPTNIESHRDHKIIFAACGQYHTFLLSDNGDVFSFGYNNDGQLGRMGNEFVPTIIPDMNLFLL